MENMKDLEIPTSDKLSIAPMMGITDNHFRTLVRFLTKETLLYTEMIHHDTIINSKKGWEYELSFPIDHKPIVIQLGGNIPDLFEKIAPLCRQVQYDEINLNCGCPSSKVTKANFGACLMKEPELVAECTKRLRFSSGLETTVKTRLGLNTDNDEFLNNFIRVVSSKGLVKHMVMHSRLAIMGLDTDKNRKIPPLNYPKVFQLTKDFPDLSFSVNGGIKTLDEVNDFLGKNKLKGCMIGRAAYENVWMLRNADSKVFNKKDPGLSRLEVVYKYADYCENVINSDKTVPYHLLLKPLTNIFTGEAHNHVFKNKLYSFNKENSLELLSDHIKETIEEFSKINKSAVNET